MKAAVCPNLIITSEVFGDRVVAMERPVLTIGRAPDCDVVISDRKVSGHHAVVRRSGDRFELQDLGSTNGTFVNGQRVTRVELQLEDEIALGHTHIVFSDRPTFEGTAKMVIASSDDGCGHQTLEIPLTGLETSFVRDVKADGDVDLAQKVELISRMGSEINSLLEVDELLEKVADLVIDLVPCDRAFILILEEGGRLTPKVIRKREGIRHQRGVTVSGSILKSALGENKGVLTKNAQEDDRFTGNKSIILYAIQSALCVPLRFKERVLGVVYLDRVTPSVPFHEEDLKLLGLVCNQVASSLSNAQAVEALRVANNELRQAKGEILRWNLDLEQKVHERTQELERKNAEISRLMREKDELLGMVAHDLRTPLTSIVGFSEIVAQHVQSGVPREQIVEAVDTVSRIAYSMSELLSDLLDVARIAAGKIRIERVKQPIDQLVRDCFNTCSFLAAAKNRHLSVEIEPDLPEVRHDPHRIVQVLNNLLSNAIKFSKAGDRVAVTARRDGDVVEVSVTDTGQGIPEEEIGRIFERFEQTSTRATNGERGAGLGLAIARRLIELHGGTIWVESKEGIGSRFTFSLPVD